MDFAEKKKNKKFGRFLRGEHVVDEHKQVIVSVTFYLGKKLAFHVASVRHSARSKKYASGGKLDDFFSVSIANMDSAKSDVSEKRQL